MNPNFPNGREYQVWRKEYNDTFFTYRGAYVAASTQDAVQQYSKTAPRKLTEGERIILKAGVHLYLVKVRIGQLTVEAM